MSSPNHVVRSAGTVRPRTPRASERAEPAPRSSWLQRGRLVGAAGMLAATIGLWWMLTDGAYRVQAADVSISGTSIVTREAVLEDLEAISREPNVLRLRSHELASSLAALPEIGGATVRISLPSTVEIVVEEREPIFVWTDGVLSWLVDQEGVMFAGPGPMADGGVGLPVVIDGRLTERAPRAGDRLGPLDMAVMTRLLALTPELLGSDAAELRLRVDERLGYELESLDIGWKARFGHFTPTLYPPERIPLQVQCLASLLEARERQVVSVWLVPTEKACGTFTRIPAGEPERGADRRQDGAERRPAG